MKSMTLAASFGTGTLLRRPWPPSLTGSRSRGGLTSWSLFPIASSSPSLKVDLWAMNSRSSSPDNPWAGRGNQSPVPGLCTILLFLTLMVTFFFLFFASASKEPEYFFFFFFLSFYMATPGCPKVEGSASKYRSSSSSNNLSSLVLGNPIRKNKA